MRTLTYSMTLQRDPKRFPGVKAIQVERGRLFGRGSGASRVHEPPARPSLHLQREPSADQRHAERERPVPVSDQQRRLGGTRQRPDRDDTRPRRRFVFDEEEGVEKLWIIRSAGAQPRLDAMKRWANPRDDGEIKDEADVGPSTRSCATTRRRRRTRRSTTSGVTTVSARADVFIRLVKLAHH